MSHFDIRLVCPVTGELESTEDIGHPTRERGEEVLAYFGGSNYQIVECSERGSHECHDTDLAYYRHHHDHLGESIEFERYSGAPTDCLISR